MIGECYIGDVRDGLQQMISVGVRAQTCVTSPPYWGLRDYGTAQWDGGDADCTHEWKKTRGDAGRPERNGGFRNGVWTDGAWTQNEPNTTVMQYRNGCGKCGATRIDRQLGLEPTIAEYVANMVEVFRLVRDVLADDGTLWLNLGDSYASNPASGGAGQQDGGEHQRTPRGIYRRPDGLKPKDLCGIPWRVAFALQQPYYTGTIKDERDRVWMAAMVDAEGSICGTEYQTGDRTKTNIYITITNTSVPIIDKCERLFPQALKHVYEKNGPSSRMCYRWDVERMDTKSLFIREIYPYLVAKRKQAIVGYTFLEMQRGLISKKKGYLAEQHDQRSWLMAALSKLNAGQDVDLPDWLIEPPSLYEPGFYLRQDIIWAKPNPMPESVTDRCTKSHEYIFLLSKRERYYFDAAAIAEEACGVPEMPRRHGNSETVQGPGGGYRVGSTTGNRNKRSVWTVTTQPYSEAHFATFPPKLIEPCILAGSRVGDVILDPFMGSGTVGQVSQDLGRRWIGCELSGDYYKMILSRTAQSGMAFV